MSRTKSRTKRAQKQTNPLADRTVQLGIGAAILIAIIAVAALVMLGDDDSTNAAYITLDAPEAYARYTQSNNAIILDVRDLSEWQQIGIPAGAVTYSLNEQLRQSLPPEDLLPKDKEIFVICNSGNRSREASQILIDNGYEDVVNIDGGIISWINNGLPIEAYTP
jgi:rhodanese-related sulfurtransferase